MKKEIDFCKEFLDKVCNKGEFKNKVIYLLEDFFFDEGWASKTNKKHMKEGYSQQYTYNYDTIRHFIEDFVRWSQREFDLKTQVSQKAKSDNTRLKKERVKNNK